MRPDVGRRKPKILTFITRMEKGGVPYEVIQVATHPEIASRYESVIATGFCENEVDIPSSIRVRRIRNFVREVNPVKDFLALLECIRVIIEEKPDIVHTRTSKAGFIGRLAAFLTRTRNVIYSPHGHILYGYFSPTKTFLFSILEYIASFFTDVVTVRTEDERRVYEDIGCRVRFFHIPKAPYKKLEVIDDPRVHSVIELLERRKREGKKIVGTVSRFEPVKGVGYLVDAFLILRKKREDVFLLLVGDGSERGRLECRLRSIPRDDYIITGWIERKDRLYSYFDVFVVPSLNEAWGVTILEAGEHGVPIVATSVGGIPYFAGGHVKLIPPRNPRLLADAISEILSSDRLAKTLSQKAKELSLRYPEDLMIRRYLELYESLLVGCRSSQLSVSASGRGQ